MFNPLYFSFTKFILAPTKSKSMKESETKHTYDRKIDENIDAEFEPEIPQKPKIYEQDQGSTGRLVRRPTGPNRSEILVRGSLNRMRLTRNTTMILMIMKMISKCLSRTNLEKKKKIKLPPRNPHQMQF